MSYSNKSRKIRRLQRRGSSSARLAIGPLSHTRSAEPISAKMLRQFVKKGLAPLATGSLAQTFFQKTPICFKLFRL
jgi:hypothetical protein